MACSGRVNARIGLVGEMDLWGCGVGIKNGTVFIFYYYFIIIFSDTCLKSLIINAEPSPSIELSN